MLLAKSLTGEELARQLIVCLSTELGISSEMLLASMHDRASVNYAAMRTKYCFPQSFFILVASPIPLTTLESTLRLQYLMNS